jgi:hypothetical protein
MKLYLLLLIAYAPRHGLSQGPNFNCTCLPEQDKDKINGWCGTHATTHDPKSHQEIDAFKSQWRIINHPIPKMMS